jgi:hypothetical protein
MITGLFDGLIVDEDVRIARDEERVEGDGVERSLGCRQDRSVYP